MRYSCFNNLLSLVWLDIKNVFASYGNLFLNSILLPIAFVLVYTQALPAFGIKTTTAHFMLIGFLVLTTHNTQLGFANDLLHMLSSKYASLYKHDMQKFSLSPALLYCRYCILYAFKSVLANVAIIPFAILFVPDFDVTYLSIPKTVLFFICMTVFIATMCTLSAVIFRSNERLWQIWPRWGILFFNVSGLRASWTTMHVAFPTIMWLDFCNPYFYVFEGMRSAIFGQAGYINFWLCCCMVIFASICSLLVGIQLFKKRFDAIG